jgi:hypothetical protein
VVPWREIEERSQTSLANCRQKANQKRKLREFTDGDLVWRKISNPRSLGPRYDGPFVVRRTSDVNYEIQGGPIKTVVHVDRLIPARQSPRVRLLPNPRGRPLGKEGGM